MGAEGGRAWDAWARIALFLDYLAIKATSAACPILDERFEYVMDDGQKELSEKIKTMLDGLSAQARATNEFKMLDETLGRFTCDPLSERRLTGGLVSLSK